MVSRWACVVVVVSALIVVGLGIHVRGLTALSRERGEELDRMQTRLNEIALTVCE